MRCCMKKESRNQIKETLGIYDSKDDKKKCQKCTFHNRQKICQIHLVKTRIDEVCNQFKPLRTHKVYGGGGVSPK